MFPFARCSLSPITRPNPNSLCMVGRRRSQSISRTWSSTFWAMLTAKLAETKDFPSPGTALVTMMDRGGLPEAGNRILPLSTLKISVSRECGLTTDTRFGSILSRLIPIEPGSDETAASFLSRWGGLRFVFDFLRDCLFSLLVGQNKVRFALRLCDGALHFRMFGLMMHGLT